MCGNGRGKRENGSFLVVCFKSFREKDDVHLGYNKKYQMKFDQTHSDLI